MVTENGKFPSMPSTIDTLINQNQNPSPPLDWKHFRYIEPTPTLYISGTSTDSATEANPSNPTKHPSIKSDYTFFTNSGHSATKGEISSKTANTRSVSRSTDAILQPPKFLHKCIYLRSYLRREKNRNILASGYKRWNTSLKSQIFWPGGKVIQWDRAK